MSYNRIPAKYIVRSEENISVNDKIIANTHTYITTETERLLKDSKEKIKKYELEALEEIDKNKEFAYKNGYEEGKKKAIQEAREQIEHEYLEKINDSQEIYQRAKEITKEQLSRLENKEKKLIEENQNKIIQLAVIISEKIVRECVEMEKINIEGIFNESVNAIRYENKRILLSLHPKTADKIKESMTKQEKDKFEFVYDLQLLYGEIKIETDMEFIDVTIENQIKQLKEKIKQV